MISILISDVYDSFLIVVEGSITISFRINKGNIILLRTHKTTNKGNKVCLRTTEFESVAHRHLQKLLHAYKSTHHHPALLQFHIGRPHSTDYSP